MRKCNAFLCLLFCFGAAVAQKHEPVNSKRDRRQIDGYTIRLVPAQGGTYGYDVIQGNKRVIHQLQNPFTMSSRGLAKKEDAFAVAQYQIKQLKAKASPLNQRGLVAANNKKLPVELKKLETSTNDETLYNQRLSPKVAEQLKISITQ